jgi:hypothetical protein
LEFHRQEVQVEQVAPAAVYRGNRCTFPPITEYLTPAEVAAILKVSTDTVIRKFENRPGVLNLGTDESRFKRKYRTLRIPRQVLEQFIHETRIH